MPTVTLYTVERSELRVPFGADSVHTMSMNLNHAIMPVNGDTPVFPHPGFSRETYPIIRLCRGGPEGIQERYIAVDRDTDQIIFDLASVKKQDYDAALGKVDRANTRANRACHRLSLFTTLPFLGRLVFLFIGRLPKSRRNQWTPEWAKNIPEEKNHD